MSHIYFRHQHVFPRPHYIHVCVCQCLNSSFLRYLLSGAPESPSWDNPRSIFWSWTNSAESFRCHLSIIPLRSFTQSSPLYNPQLLIESISQSIIGLSGQTLAEWRSLSVVYMHAAASPWTWLQVAWMPPRVAQQLWFYQIISEFIQWAEHMFTVPIVSFFKDYVEVRKPLSGH